MHPPALRAPCSALSSAELRDAMGWAQSLAQSWDRTGTEPGRATGWARSLAEPQDGTGMEQGAELQDGHIAWQSHGMGWTGH